MHYFSSSPKACLCGPALAPLVGGNFNSLRPVLTLTQPHVSGLAAHYSSWRVTQFGLCISGVVAFILMLVYLPETSHPNTRGIDKLRIANTTRSRWRILFFDPFKSLGLLRSPNLFAVVRLLDSAHLPLMRFKLLLKYRR
jgi:hypothetical protein